MKKLAPILSRQSLALLCLFMIAAPALTGCDDDKDSDEVSELSEEETDAPGQELNAAHEFASRLNVDDQLFVSVGSMERLLATPETLIGSEQVSTENLEQWQQAWGEVRGLVEANAGADLTDSDTWRQWGIDPTGALFVGAVGNDPIICVTAEDHSQFDDFVVDFLATELLHLGEPERDDSEVHGEDIHIVGDQLGWTHLDNSTCLTISTTDTALSDVLATFIEGPGDGHSIADSSGFESFIESGMNDGLAAIFSEDSDAFLDFISPVVPFGARGMISNFAAGLGAGIFVENDILSVRLWGELDDEESQLVQGVTTPSHSFDWSGFATEETTAALRLSLNPQEIWKQFTETAGEHFQAAADELFDDAALATGGEVDAESHLIENISGQIGFFVYNIDDPETLMGSDSLDLAEDIEALVAIHFIDEEPLDELMEGLKEFNLEGEESFLSHRLLQEADGSEAADINIVEFEDVDIRLYQKSEMIVLATYAMSETDIASILRGERSEKSLANTKAPLGAALEEENFNGLYVGGNAWTLVEELMELPDMSQNLDEMLLRIDAADTGMTISINSYPAGSAIFGGVLAAMNANDGARVVADDGDSPAH